MAREQYIIYKITSPSGKAYIGLTKGPLEKRWKEHQKKALNGYKHPFHSAIRKYGPSIFLIEHIACAIGFADAQDAEVLCIAQTPEKYNLSPGGTGDSRIASKIFWDEMRANPKKMDGYRERLILAQKNRPPESKESLEKRKELARLWRKNNPREAWKNSYRASRIAAKKAKLVGARAKTTEPRTLKEILLAKHKHLRPRGSLATAKMWAQRGVGDRISLGIKISESLKLLHADPEYKKQHSIKLIEVRSHIDRNHQSKQASK